MPKPGYVSVRFPPELLDRMRAAAEADGVTQALFVRMAVEVALGSPSRADALEARVATLEDENERLDRRLRVVERGTRTFG